MKQFRALLIYAFIFYGLYLGGMRDIWWAEKLVQSWVWFLFILCVILSFFAPIDAPKEDDRPLPTWITRPISITFAVCMVIVGWYFTAAMQVSTMILYRLIKKKKPAEKEAKKSKCETGEQPCE